jgi:DNA-binding protein H-NS
MERNSMNLKSMSIDQLVALRDRFNEALGAKVTDQRRALEAELSKLTRFQGGPAGSKSGGRRGDKAPVAPKYRNPENPSETWAGRGLRPRWLSAALKSGKKLDEFLIPGIMVPPPKAMPRRKMARAAM